MTTCIVDNFTPQNQSSFLLKFTISHVFVIKESHKIRKLSYIPKLSPTYITFNKFLKTLKPKSKTNGNNPILFFNFCRSRKRNKEGSCGVRRRIVCGFC